MKVVDTETRAEIKNARLEALESDNFDEGAKQQNDDDFVLEDEDEEASFLTKKKTKKSTRSSAQPPVRREKVHKKLDQILAEANLHGLPPENPTYFTINAAGSFSLPDIFVQSAGFSPPMSVRVAAAGTAKSSASRHTKRPGV
eukprot:CAMPEP_0184663900 /NCGR_PEP_ID=MMETSP0308-20130426/50423_1 /TAXON_ID=38269 /ORGANISM="Gloeochaete witrockiana, Strain SAG 46.84" /LENGTH=142 /DNA_ID=CAMNT_0027106967 /DNA_START=42 /DNA_END=471 /DNA_ORIENTATION=+